MLKICAARSSRQKPIARALSSRARFVSCSAQAQEKLCTPHAFVPNRAVIEPVIDPTWLSERDLCRALLCSKGNEWNWRRRLDTRCCPLSSLYPSNKPRPFPIKLRRSVAFATGAPSHDCEIAVAVSPASHGVGASEMAKECDGGWMPRPPRELKKGQHRIQIESEELRDPNIPLIGEYAYPNMPMKL